MHPVEALHHLGGLSDLRTLRRLCTRWEIEKALDAGLVRRGGHGRYALAEVDDARRVAHATNGVLCLASAALAHGWAVKELPERPQVCYPKDRRLSRHSRQQVQARWADLDPAEVDGHVTSPSKTLEMCARSLPYDQALAIADSALRSGELATLRSLRHVRGRGAARIKRVVADANPLAANPFESVLRAIAADVSGLSFTPQVQIGAHRPDLVDAERRIVAEADSFEWHGSRAALRRDAARYNELVVMGWMVLRFSWEDVMHQPDDVRRILERAVVLAFQRTKVASVRRQAPESASLVC